MTTTFLNINIRNLTHTYGIGHLWESTAYFLTQGFGAWEGYREHGTHHSTDGCFLEGRFDILSSRAQTSTLQTPTLSKILVFGVHLFNI